MRGCGRRSAHGGWGPATAVHSLKLFYNIAGAFKIIPFSAEYSQLIGAVSFLLNRKVIKMCVEGLRAIPLECSDCYDKDNGTGSHA